MEITGFDCVSITPETPAKVFSGMFDSLTVKWPSPHLEVIEEIGSGEGWQGNMPPLELLSKEGGIIHCSRDKNMDASFSADGYYIGRDGEGPFSFYLALLKTSIDL